MKQISLKLLAKYEDQYVAISGNKSEIITAGKTMEELQKNLEKLKVKDIIIYYVPPLKVAISPVCQ